jgi:hypothetical protein
MLHAQTIWTPPELGRKSSIDGVPVYSFILGKDWVGAGLSSAFCVQNGLKQGDALSPLLFSFTSEHDIGNI